MKDPERLLTSTGDGDDFERELLGSLRGGAPPAGAKDEAWQKIGSQIAAVAMIGSTVGSVPPSAGGTGLVTALAKASVAKVALAIAATAVVLGGGVVVARHRAPPDPVSIATTVSPAADRAPELEPARTSATLTVPAVVVVSPSRGASPVPRASADGTASARLAAESSLLTAARAELVSGDARAAQSTLARMQTEFPHGVLSQEREVLAIEALAADGKTDAAARRARAFIAAHPESPHSAQLGRFIEGP